MRLSYTRKWVLFTYLWGNMKVQGTLEFIIFMSLTLLTLWLVTLTHPMYKVEDIEHCPRVIKTLLWTFLCCCHSILISFSINSIIFYCGVNLIDYIFDRKYFYVSHNLFIISHFLLDVQLCQFCLVESWILLCSYKYSYTPSGMQFSCGKTVMGLAFQFVRWNKWRFHFSLISPITNATPSWVTYLKFLQLWSTSF